MNIKKSWIIEHAKDTIGPFTNKKAAWLWGLKYLGEHNTDWNIRFSPVRANTLPRDAAALIEAQ